MGRSQSSNCACPARRALRSALDISKAKAVLKWTPEWKFEDGLGLLVEWFEKEGAR